VTGEWFAAEMRKDYCMKKRRRSGENNLTRGRPKEERDHEQVDRFLAECEKWEQRALRFGAALLTILALIKVLTGECRSVLRTPTGGSQPAEPGHTQRADSAPADTRKASAGSALADP
jgi:hypothetical protein